MTTNVPTCLMCLEAPAVHSIGTCQHSYCKSCLTKYEAQQPDAETFPCPTCRVQDPEQTLAKEDTDEATVGAHDVGVRSSRPTTDAVVTKVDDSLWENCKTCGHNDKQTQAVGICWECSNLPLCKDCALVHEKSKATQNHVVTIVLSFKKGEFLCGTHSEPLKSFCCNCTEPLCPVCVMCEHSDHEIKGLGDVSLMKVEEVKTEMEAEMKRLEELQSDEKELEKSRATAMTMEDALVRAIEDQAEVLIEQILKNKDTLKKQVKKKFEVIWELTKCLEALPDLIKESEKVIEKSKMLLEKVELDPKHLEELLKTTIKEDFQRLRSGQPEYGSCKVNYRSAFENLKKKSLTFYPKTLKLEIGGLEKPDQEKLKRICKGRGFCMCETCGRIPKADKNRRGECDRVGACTCGTCDLRIAKANLQRRAECERLGCRCAVCDIEIPWPNPLRKAECITQGSCRCKVCDSDILIPSSDNEWTCIDTGYCKCGICNNVITTDVCKGSGRSSDCTCDNCNDRFMRGSDLLGSLFVIGLVVVLFMYMFSYFSDHPACPAVEKHNLLSFTTHETNHGSHNWMTPAYHECFTYCLVGCFVYLVDALLFLS